MSGTHLTESTVTANGLTFATLQAGTDGPLALCLHGFPDSAWTWRHLLPELAAAGFRAVAPFLRGYAPTEVPADGLFQTGAQAADAIALHEALGGDGDAVLIGHDVGAIASYSIVGSAPELWRRVVTMSIAPPHLMAQDFFVYDQLKRSWYVFFHQTPLADMVVPMDDHAYIDRIWADWSPGFDGAEFRSQAKAALAGSDNVAAALGWYRATLGSGPRDDRYNLVEAAANAPVRVPMLYLHGSADGCFAAPSDHDSVMAHLSAPGSRFELIDGAGHFLHLEQPEAVNRLIVDFVTG